MCPHINMIEKDQAKPTSPKTFQASLEYYWEITNSGGGEPNKDYLGSLIGDGRNRAPFLVRILQIIKLIFPTR
jgi:hypothetical protein